jgi:hypothetical protein
MPTTPHIRTLVENFANELSQVMRRATLEEVHAKLSLAFGDVSAPKQRGPSRPRATVSKGVLRMKPAGKRGRPGKFTPEQLEKHGASILALLKKSPGARSEQVSAAMRMDAATLRIPLKALIAAKKVRVRCSGSRTRTEAPRCRDFCGQREPGHLDQERSQRTCVRALASESNSPEVNSPSRGGRIGSGCPEEHGDYLL